MSVKRKDVIGDKDMYVSFIKPDGTYTAPKNMGNVINTFMGEGTPFIAPDGKTMYMYSEGFPGFGSADIYVTKRLDETWLNWSTPKNIGEPANTADWDTYYTVSAKGDFAYLVSTADAIGGSDIFMIQLADEAKPDPVVLLSGKVLNAKTNLPIAANIDYEDLATGKKLGVARSNPATGEYTIVLPYGKNYGVRAYAENYISVNENFDFTQIKEYQELTKNLYLSPIEVGQLVKLNNVFFVQGKAILTNESYPELDRLVDLMKNNPKMEIRLEGHTESGGNRNEKLLVQLSQERVQSVKEYMKEHGIAGERITGIGYGGSKPLVTGEVDQTQNRRVEFVITKK
jgi:outer membrane protein OmpA-like peptidoglycan-associated protein